jgi:hypothetical protein
MHPKITRHHNDHDDYADDVKDIHCFAPIERPRVFNVPGRRMRIAEVSDFGLS